ncbi:sugar transferase, partial [Cytophagales bacterium RKSG123]|nr:sugar transferase [Xanthovirga aplysinae]
MFFFFLPLFVLLSLLILFMDGEALFYFQKRLGK